MNKNSIRKSIDNSIRSLFQMIVIINDPTGICDIIDHNAELSNISAENNSDTKTCPFSVLRKNLVINIHPEDREEFCRFTDRDRYVKLLQSRVHLSMELEMADAKMYEMRTERDKYRRD